MPRTNCRHRSVARVLLPSRNGPRRHTHCSENVELWHWLPVGSKPGARYLRNRVGERVATSGMPPCTAPRITRPKEQRRRSDDNERPPIFAESTILFMTLRRDADKGQWTPLLAVSHQQGVTERAALSRAARNTERIRAPSALGTIGEMVLIVNEVLGIKRPASRPEDRGLEEAAWAWRRRQNSGWREYTRNEGSRNDDAAFGAKEKRPSRLAEPATKKRAASNLCATVILNPPSAAGLS